MPLACRPLIGSTSLRCFARRSRRQYVARIPHPSANPEEWLKHYGSMKIEEPVQ